MTKKTNSPTDKEEVKKINSVPYHFSLESFHPDLRQYKPSNPVIVPDQKITIIVRVPLEVELIENAIDIAGDPLTNKSTDPEPVLTPLGLRYIIDQFEEAMGNGSKETAKENDSEEDEFGDESSSESKLVSSSNDDEEWEDETDQPEVEKPEENFDEDWS